MSKPVALIDKDVQVAITLASIGYLAEGEPIDDKKQRMLQALAVPDLPTARSWQLVWGPTDYDTALWFIVAGRSVAGRNAVAVVIRGTQMSMYESLKEDAPSPLVPLPFFGQPVPADVRASAGFCDEYMRLMTALDVTRGGSGKGAIDFLRSFLAANPRYEELHVIGHSLGGAVAPLMALRLQWVFRKLVVRAFPFAGQSPGNRALADWFRKSFPNQQYLRWVNRLDVGPMMFGEMSDLMSSWAGGPPCPWGIKLAIEALGKSFAGYVSLPDAFHYEGTLYPSDPNDPHPWSTQTSHQHQHLYYLWMSGVALDVINRSFLPLQLQLPPADVPT